MLFFNKYRESAKQAGDCAEEHQAQEHAVPGAVVGNEAEQRGTHGGADIAEGVQHAGEQTGIHFVAHRQRNDAGDHVVDRGHQHGGKTEEHDQKHGAVRCAGGRAGARQKEHRHEHGRFNAIEHGVEL